MMQQREMFLAELEKYMREVKGLTESAIRIYLRRIRRLLDSGYSVDDLKGDADRLYGEYGSKGQMYDPKDHGNNRAAVKHVADMVRDEFLEKMRDIYVSYDMGWTSFRPKDEYECGYKIQGGEVTFLYNVGFGAGKKVTKKISATDLKKLVSLFKRAQGNGCLASSNTCIKTIHGNQCAYDYDVLGMTGNNCGCLFDGDSACAEQLDKEYRQLMDKLRAQ